MKEQKNVIGANNTKDKKASLLDVLLDRENREHITLVSDTGDVIAFEQVAIIPQDKRLFCILHPLDKFDDVADDEAVVFECVDKDTLEAVVDNDLAEQVYEEYRKLLAEAK